MMSIGFWHTTGARRTDSIAQGDLSAIEFTSYFDRPRTPLGLLIPGRSSTRRRSGLTSLVESLILCTATIPSRGIPKGGIAR